MKRLFSYGIVIICLLLSCSPKAGQIRTAVLAPLTLDSIPPVEFIGSFQINSGDLYVSFSYPGGMNHYKLRRYELDTLNHLLSYKKEYFRRDSNYYHIFTPVIFWDAHNQLYAFERGNPLLYKVGQDSIYRTGDALISLRAKVPRELTLDVRQGFYKSPRQYYFLGRGAKKSHQGIFLSDNTGDSIAITEIHSIIYDEDFPFWGVNFGMMTYHPTKQKFAFVYKLYPTLQLYDLQKKKGKRISVAKINVDTSQFEEADIWDTNPIQFQFVTSNDKYIYALYFAEKFKDMEEAQQQGRVQCKVYQFDWDGKVINTFSINKWLDAIAVSEDDDFLIAHERKGRFYLLSFN